MNTETPNGRELRSDPSQACTQRPAAERARQDLLCSSHPAPVPAPGGRRRLQSDCCLAASAESGTMKLLPSVVLKLLLAAGKRAAGGRGGWGRSAGDTEEDRCSAPGAGHLVGPVLPGRRAPAAVRGDGGLGGGSEAASSLTRSALGVGDRRQPGAASKRAGGWNQQSGLPYSIYGPAAAPGRWPRPGSPGLGRDRPGPFQRWV